MAELKLEKRMADVLWTLQDGTNVTEQCLRGIPWIYRHIDDSPHKDTASRVVVRWMNQAIKTEVKDGQRVPVMDPLGNPVSVEIEQKLLDCTPTEARDGQPAVTLMDNVKLALTAEQQRVGSPVAKLYSVISQLMEAWDIRMVILTMLAGDERVEGLGLITESAPVTEQNIVLFAESAANQVDQFKAEMRKKHDIMFLGDRGKLVIPGQ
jgi:hypothetical protein